MEFFHGEDADLSMMLLPDEPIADGYRADPDLPRKDGLLQDAPVAPPA